MFFWVLFSLLALAAAALVVFAARMKKDDAYIQIPEFKKRQGDRAVNITHCSPTGDCSYG